MDRLTTFVRGQIPLTQAIAACLKPDALQSLRSVSRGVCTLLESNKETLLRESWAAQRRAYLISLVDDLNAPKADRKDTFAARYKSSAAEGRSLAKPQPVTGYTQHCAEKNRAWRLQLVAEMPNRPYAAQYAAAAVHALNLRPRAKPTYGWRASALREQLDDREAYEQLDWRSAQRWLDGLTEDPEAELAVRSLALTYVPGPVEVPSPTTSPASDEEEDPLGESLKDYYFHEYVDRADGWPEILKRLQRSWRPPSTEPFDTSIVERVADAFQLDGLARWAFIAAAELRVGDLAVRGACGVINRFEFLHGCHMPSWEGFWEDLRHPDLGLFPEEGSGGAIQDGVVRALCIMAAATMSPQTFDRHCCHYFRKATQRCFGDHAHAFFAALHGDAGATIILKRMAQGPGHKLHADGERPNGHAYDCCNMTVVADGAVGRYQIRQNQVGDRPVTLARGLTREAARHVVLSFEFDASIERREPRDWPDGVWRSFKDRNAWKWGTGGLRAAFVERVRYVEEESALYAQYRNYPLLGLYRFQRLNGIHQTLENVRECAPGFDASYKEDEDKKRPYDAYRRYKVGGPRSRRDARVERGRAIALPQSAARRAAADAGLQTDVATAEGAARRQTFEFRLAVHVVPPDAGRAPTATSSDYWGVAWDVGSKAWKTYYTDAHGERRGCGHYATQERAAVERLRRIRREGVERKNRLNPIVDMRLAPRVRKRRREEPAAAAPAPAPTRASERNRTPRVKSDLGAGSTRVEKRGKASPP